MIGMKNWIYLFLIFAAVSFCGCEKGEHGDSVRVDAAVQESLYRLYPDASNVEWSVRGEYFVAKFNLPATRSETPAPAWYTAWFSGSGEWYMTESDILFDNLPAAVREAFRASEYASWRVDDVDVLRREGVEVLYVIEVEGVQEGRKTEIDLYYSEDGVLVRTVADADSDYDYGDCIPSQIPERIADFIAKKYPGARIMETDRENGLTEVEILDGRVSRELLFDASDEWIYTKTETLYSQLPETVKSAYASPAYASYRIDDIDRYETPSGGFYRFDLKSIAGDIELDIADDGTLTVRDFTSPDDDGVAGDGGMVDSAIKELIMQKYPGARIVEYDYDDGMLEVEIIHDRREKSVCFNGAKAWVKTTWDLRSGELPAAVTSAISASGYAAYKIDEAEYVQTPAGDYYIVELESGSREIELRIDANGNVLR